MKALSLTQPWATLVAIGAKQIETRSWSTNYRGRLAIHAAKGIPPDALALLMEQPFRGILESAGIERLAMLPRGQIVATASLVRIVPTTSFLASSKPLAQELAFGDYSPGRFAWILEDIQRLDFPIAAKGALGLWEWTQ